MKKYCVQYNFDSQNTCRAEHFDEKEKAFDFAKQQKGVVNLQEHGRFEPIKLIPIANFR